MATCPACAETIPSSAETCPYCGISIHQYAPATRGGSGGGGGKSSSKFPLFLIIGGSIVGLLLCSGVPIALLLPAVQQAREAARRSQCKNNLKQIGLALHNYHDKYNTFPPAYFADAAGRPMHSWRVMILPFIDQDPLYKQYKWDEPWDGPNNSRLMAQIPPVFRCPSHAGTPGDTTTAYAAVFGDDCVFRSSGSTRMADITDGTSNTILVGEVERAGIPWMKPEDVDVSKHPTIGDPAGFSSLHIGGIHVLLADGSVRFISENISPATLRGLYTRAGNEQIGDY